MTRISSVEGMDGMEGGPRKGVEVMGLETDERSSCGATTVGVWNASLCENSSGEITQSDSIINLLQ